MEALGAFVGIWLVFLVVMVPCGLIVMGVIAFSDPDDFDSITRRKKAAWVIGVLFWPFALGFMTIVGVLAAVGYRHPKVTRFSEWLGE
jgi:hypothetical protein